MKTIPVIILLVAVGCANRSTCEGTFQDFYEACLAVDCDATITAAAAADSGDEVECQVTCSCNGSGTVVVTDYYNGASAAPTYIDNQDNMEVGEDDNICAVE